MDRLVLLLLACGVVSAALAHRARRAGTGAILGLFFGPVGILLTAYLLPRWHRASAARASTPDGS